MQASPADGDCRARLLPMLCAAGRPSLGLLGLQIGVHLKGLCASGWGSLHVRVGCATAASGTARVLSSAHHAGKNS
jgi:hypothetical protein